MFSGSNACIFLPLHCKVVQPLSYFAVRQIAVIWISGHTINDNSICFVRNHSKYFSKIKKNPTRHRERGTASLPVCIIHTENECSCSPRVHVIQGAAFSWFLSKIRRWRKKTYQHSVSIKRTTYSVYCMRTTLVVFLTHYAGVNVIVLELEMCFLKV